YTNDIDLHVSTRGCEHFCCLFCTCRSICFIALCPVGIGSHCSFFRNYCVSTIVFSVGKPRCFCVLKTPRVSRRPGRCRFSWKRQDETCVRKAYSAFGLCAYRGGPTSCCDDENQWPKENIHVIFDPP